jgi:hypothetical protein
MTVLMFVARQVAATPFQDGLRAGTWPEIVGAVAINGPDHTAFGVPSATQTMLWSALTDAVSRHLLACVEIRGGLSRR